jgi:hypothetical protein
MKFPHSFLKVVAEKAIISNCELYVGAQRNDFEGKMDALVNFSTLFQSSLSFNFRHAFTFPTLL